MTPQRRTAVLVATATTTALLLSAQPALSAPSSDATADRSSPCLTGWLRRVASWVEVPAVSPVTARSTSALLAPGGPSTTTCRSVPARRVVTMTFMSPWWSTPAGRPRVCPQAWSGCRTPGPARA